MPKVAREKTRGRLLQRLGIDLYPGEGQTVSLLFLGFFLVISFQYVTKTVRQSTFIDSLGAHNLPWVYLLVALFAYPYWPIRSTKTWLNALIGHPDR